MHQTGIAADPVVQRHEVGNGHPERPERYIAVINSLESSGLMRRAARLSARVATDDELALAHTPEYVALVRRETSAGRPQLSTGDTDLSSHVLASALAAAGSALEAVDSVFTKNTGNAFCVVRPPGHHARQDAGMGFCLFNNVAVAARYAQRKYGAERVLIADWDVHHGNGTQDIFYQDGSVLFFSTHQSPWYPGTGAVTETGEGAGAGKTINCPLPAGAGSAKILGAFREKLLPAAEAFRPDLVLISAGFDSRVGDPLGHFLLTEADFAELTQMLGELAARYSDGRLISVLEGGYSLTGLALAAEAHVRALLGDK